MAKRHVLYFTGEDQYLYASSGKQLELEATFPPGELGLTRFREYLRGRHGALFSLVADLAGEDFHEEQIPLLRGADRDAIVKRKLVQRYRDVRLAAALPLGAVDTGERRNERLLLASFTNTQQLEPWLDALEESGARLAGVYSVPLVAPVLAARVGLKGECCLVVSANRAGLRQCFVRNGRLRFARLERTLDMVPQALAMFVRSETVRLVQYLTTLRALPREAEEVRVVVIAPRGQQAVFEQALGSDSRLKFRVLEIGEAARKAGIRRVPDGAGAEALYLHLAAKNAPREQFASRDERRRYLVWQLQRGIVAGSAVGFAACAAFAGFIWLEGAQVRDNTAAQLRDARAAAEQYERITAAFPVTQTSTENLKAAVVEFQRIAQRSAMPEDALVHVSRVLEKFPQFEIDGVVWSVGRPDRRDRPGGAASTPAKSEGQADSAVRLEIAGRVNAMERNDYRGLSAEVQRFASALAVSGYDLVRTQLPFDITPEGTLTGDIGNSTETGEAPRFTVVVSRRLP